MCQEWYTRSKRRKDKFQILGAATLKKWTPSDVRTNILFIDLNIGGKGRKPLICR